MTALTHWLDYQLYPDSPALMHAHNIAWFAAVVFLLTVVYRKLMGPGWAAGLAGLLFLLDYNTCFPVAFVANRGFILSLGLGLDAIRWSNLFLGELEFKPGRRFEQGGLVVEILAVDAAKLPSRVACRFNASLDASTFHWLQFNGETRSYEPFPVPPIGRRITVPGLVR